ncbi:MAG: CoA-binding protein [Crocinitomicaceae bacterium]|nr:CoA-binding protein [Crocinitomicaceae bacterium]
MKQKVLIIGASTNPSRYAYLATNMLLDDGHEVHLHGLREGQVRGITIQTEQKMIENLDTITLYVGPRNQQSLYDYIVKLNPKRVIFNPGTENPELYDLLRENNIEVVVACTLVMIRTKQFELQG